MKAILYAIFLTTLSLPAFSGFQIPVAEGSEVHDVSISNVTAWPAFVVPSMVIHINVTVENQGTSNESFNLTAYADNLTIQTVKVTDLASGANKTLTFELKISYTDYMIAVFPPPWAPYEPMLENITMWAEASVVAGEVDTSDNAYIDGTVTIIWLPPDIDGNGIVDIYDVVFIVHDYGSEIGDPEYNVLADFNQDGKINIYDIVILGGVYGTAYV